LALLDAGIEMRDIVTACSVISFFADGKRRIVVDPTDEELVLLNKCDNLSRVSIASMSNLGEMTSVTSYGRFSDPASLGTLTQTALSGCNLMRGEIATKLRQSETK
jgi:ribonuclease PH